MLKSIRTAAGPRQEVVLNLGELDLPKEHWKALANAIEERINNQSSLSISGNCEEVDRLAGHFSQMVVSAAINRQQDADDELLDDQGKRLDQEAMQESPLYESVDINSIRASESRSVGAEYLLLEQMKAYGFDEILQEAGFTAKQADYAKHLIAGRAVHPSSERETARWINENSAMKELMGSEERVYDNALHRTAVLLWKNGERIEKVLTNKAKDLFSLDEKIILYDLTNTYFEGSKTGSSIAQFGRSKEKRSDCKLATLALVVDSEGFPKESRILKGNVSEPETFGEILESVAKLGQAEAKKTIVIDAGIATDENIALIKERKMHFVAVSRKRSYDPSLWDRSEEKTVLLNDGKTALTLKLAIVDDGSSAEGEEDGSKEAFPLCQVSYLAA